MVLITKDYGLIAYVILYHNGTRTQNGVTYNDIKTNIELVKEYHNSDFSTYNNILKQIVKG